MLRAEVGLERHRVLFELPERVGRVGISIPAAHGGEVVAGRDDVGVCRAEDPKPVVEQLLHLDRRFGGSPRFVEKLGAVPAGIERGGVVGAEEPFTVDDQGVGECQRLLGSAAAADGAQQVAAGDEGLRVLGAEHLGTPSDHVGED